MAQVQFTLTLTVDPAPNPLTEGSLVGSATFVAGTFGSFILAPISGGVPPYSASVDAASANQLPTGLTVGIDAANNLIVSGTTPTAGGPADVLLDVQDSLGNSVAKATIRM